VNRDMRQNNGRECIQSLFPSRSSWSNYPPIDLDPRSDVFQSLVPCEDKKLCSLFQICGKRRFVCLCAACGEKKNFLVGLNAQCLQRDDDRDVFV